MLGGPAARAAGCLTDMFFSGGTFGTCHCCCERRVGGGAMATGRAVSGLGVIFRAKPDPALSQSAAVVTGGNSDDPRHGESSLN